MICPAWIFDISAARVASEYLSAELPIEAFGTKYASGLSEKYSDITAEELVESAQLILEFLAEVEAGESAVSIINEFTFLPALLCEGWSSAKNETDVRLD